MKIFLVILFASIIFLGCSEKKVPDKDQEKTLFDEVIKVHDDVMGADEHLMKNKMLLDSMVKHNSTADVKDSVYTYLGKLNLADSAMSSWMHKFDAENTGKSHEQIMSYLSDQKKQIEGVKTQINGALAVSDKYLAKWKMK